MNFLAGTRFVSALDLFLKKIKITEFGLGPFFLPLKIRGIKGEGFSIPFFKRRESAIRMVSMGNSRATRTRDFFACDVK